MELRFKHDDHHKKYYFINVVMLFFRTTIQVINSEKRRVKTLDYLQFSVAGVARVKFSLKLQESFAAAFLKSGEFIILLFIHWWKHSRVSVTILQSKH